MATSQIYCENMKKKIEELYELCQIGPSERQPVDFGKYLFVFRFFLLLLSTSFFL